MGWLGRLLGGKGEGDTDGMGRSTESPRLELGKRGERVAAKILKHDGYRILERNLRLRSGEIDLVCLAPDERTIVVVEVKSRRIRPASALRPEDSVPLKKRDTLVRLAREVRLARQWEDRPIRIDVMGMDFDESGELLEARHIEAAVTGRI